MPLSRKEKESLLNEYEKYILESKNLIFLSQSDIPVNEVNILRREVKKNWWLLQVVKKRIFVKALEKVWYEKIDVEKLIWSVMVLYSIEDEFKPIKIVNKFKKSWEKENKDYKVEYLWWYFDKKFKDGLYVKDVAELPTKDELIAKFAFLLKYPVQSFAFCLKQIAEKK